MLTLAHPHPPPQPIWFQVMLYNGQQLIIAGHVKISPTDNYTTFNSSIGQLINVSPDCIKSYLMDTAIPGATSPMQYQWKATISAWTDFSLVCQQKDCCFLVIVRPMNNNLIGYQDPIFSSGYVNWVQDWVHRRKMVEMEQRQNNTNNVANVFNVGQIQIRQRPEQRRSSHPKVITCSGVCEECNDTAAGADDQFHYCKLDAIVVDGYRTSFGPIGPPKVEPMVKEPEVVESDGLYSLFGPMAGVDSILQGMRQSIGYTYN